MAKRTDCPRVLEVGAGLGTMVARLVDLGVVSRAEYTCLDISPELTAASRQWLLAWSLDHGCECAEDADSLRIRRDAIDLTIRFLTEDLHAFLATPPRERFDLLIANAFLDLVNVPWILPRLFAHLTKHGLFWFSINFDGETTLLPALPEDTEFFQVYHRSMDTRVKDGISSGDSKTGRHLFLNLATAGATILAVGASDWVVHPVRSTYLDDEAYFLECILNTIDLELRKHAEVEPRRLRNWINKRREQLLKHELVLVTHQLDFFGIGSR
ncbi:MAG TPA: class I SAM-dependent methyltransferase [Polyangiaceae bacterium]|nr:class I SAM-dependent methyltransferase [Polyangiaceae bacterium]